MPASTSDSGLRQVVHEGRLTAALALPLAAGQLSQMLIALSDTLMVGRLGVLPLAAATFANNVLYLPFIFGLGFTTAVSIRVSQARGGGDQPAARAALRHGFYLALVIGGLTMLGVWGIQPFLGLFRQEPEIVRAVPRYFLLVAASMIPALGTMAVKSHADAMNKPWVPLWILLAGAALNVFFNWVFIYGKLGAPRMGLDGSGLATLLSRIAILVVMLRWSMRARSVRDWVPTHWFRALEWNAVRDLVRLGIPTSVQLLAEVSAFVMATLLIGTLGPAALASHQVAMTCSAMIFMVPLGVSMAMTVRMGEAWGSAQVVRLRSILASGWALVLIFTVGSAQAFLFFHHTIASWFLTDPSAIALTANLLLIAAAFQVSDALQVSSAGALRGLGDVKVPVAVAIVAYWVVSIPVGWWLAFPRGLGVIGVWLGITLGLTITALTLGARVWRMTAASGIPSTIR
ncbi:MAG: MATE family efflux transporter [Chthoniobacterales bacterium]